MKKVTRKKASKSPVIEVDADNNITELYVSTNNNSFFYTNDKTLNDLDTQDIVISISRKYPDFNPSNDDSLVKKTFKEILDNDQFMEYILTFYNINIFDLFKILYRNFSSIFKGQYLKKIRDQLATKTYAKINR